MYSLGYLLLLAAILGAAAKPSTNLMSLHIDTMKNKTVCAMEVKINTDENRIPKYIKEIKCAKETNQWCTQNAIPFKQCCHHTDNRHVMACAEITDVIMVMNTTSNTMESLEVAVGCTCSIMDSTPAGIP